MHDNNLRRTVLVRQLEQERQDHNAKVAARAFEPEQLTAGLLFEFLEALAWDERPYRRVDATDSRPLLKLER